jgi:hypothetical protein
MGRIPGLVARSARTVGAVDAIDDPDGEPDAALDGLAESLLDAGRRAAAIEARRLAGARRARACELEEVGSEVRRIADGGGTAAVTTVHGLRCEGRLVVCSGTLVVVVDVDGWWALDATTVAVVEQGTAAAAADAPPSQRSGPGAGWPVLVAEAWVRTLADAIAVLADERAEVALWVGGRWAEGRLRSAGADVVRLQGPERAAVVRLAAIGAVRVARPVGATAPGDQSSASPLSPLPTTSG